jgi:hypothetical protein
VEQFFSGVDEGGQRILDLGEFTQANVSFITDLGMRLYSEDLQQTLDSIFGGGDPAETQAESARAKYFLDHVLQFPDEYFDAVLVWDTLELLSPPLLKAVMERLSAVLKPKAMVFACFHPESRDDTAQQISYRIADGRNLQLLPKGRRRLAQTFSNRGIERVFEGFQSVKFFLTRDSLREVIVRR